MADGLELTPEELAKLIAEVERYGVRVPPAATGWSLLQWLRFLGALGFLIAALAFLVKRIHQARHLEDVIELPPGGTSCGSGSPAELRLAQTKLPASGWSFSGEAEAFKDALADASAQAKKLGASVCGASGCAPGKTCQGVPAIQDVEYVSWTQLFLATRCKLKFTVYCECV
jgi:hypothetical protein